MSVDIVNLIESNPITKFTGDYQSKLIENVKNTFTNYEQQLFLSSFYCYLKYDSKNDFVIDLDTIWKWLGFSQKDASKRVLEKNFLINKDYKFFAPQVGGAKKDNRGGHNKEIIMLNVETFKRFCLKAGTKKADEIHDYFIKLENIMFEITKEEGDELKQQLNQIEDIKNKEMATKLIKQKELDREKLLLNEYSNIGNMIYIIKVKTLDDSSYVIKIGESRKGIVDRYNECKTKHKNILLLDCFKVDKCKDFESFLHNHTLIYPNKCKNLSGHENENELFLIGKDLTYKQLLKLTTDNIDTFNYRVKELLLENELLKSQLHSTPNNNDNDLLLELLNSVKILTNKVSNLEQTNKEILDKLNFQETKVVTGFNQPLSNLGPRVQKINPETITIVKIYETVTEVMNEDKNIKRPSIKKAIEENTIYCGFRWLLVERNLDPNIIHNIESTKETKVQNLGYIAKVNSNKSEILNVYLDRKTASQMNGYYRSSSLDNPVKNNTLTNGYYYTLYDKCSNELIQKFEEINGKPLLYKNGFGKYDSNYNLIREFSSKSDAIRELKMSDKTLAKSLQQNIPYNNFYYKELGSKVVYL
jgi:hypothetical protein